MTSQIIKVEPFDLIVFGGTGDLAYRKLFPALIHRDKDDQFKEPTRIIGVSRRRMERDAFRATVREALLKFGGASDPSAPYVERFLDRIVYAAVDVTGDDGWDALKGLLGPDERVRAFYMATGPDLFGPIAERLGANGLVTRRSRDHRGKADRQGRRERRGDQRRDRRGVPGEPHFPHRPLSRQGNGAEPDGAALRQRPVRAAVEQRAYRSRADHRRRDARRRRPRRLLRQFRRAARHGAEPYAAIAVPGRDGAARLARSRRVARREAESAEIAGADRRRQRAGVDRARPVPRRLRRRRGRPRPICRTSARRRATPRLSSP